MLGRTFFLLAPALNIDSLCDTFETIWWYSGVLCTLIGLYRPLPTATIEQMVKNEIVRCSHTFDTPEERHEFLVQEEEAWDTITSSSMYQSCADKGITYYAHLMARYTMHRLQTHHFRTPALARKWWAAHIEQIDRERCRQWRQLNEWMTSGITTLTLFVRGSSTTLHTHLD